MNTNHVFLLLAALLLCGVGLFMTTQMGEADSDSAELQILPQIGLIAERLESMDDRMVAMEQQVDAMASRPAGSNIDRSLDAETINRMIAQALEEQGGVFVQEAKGDGAEEKASAAAKERLLNDSIAKFLDPNFESEDREKLWDQLKEQGLIEQAIALLELEVEGNPENINLMNQLAYAYLQPIIRAGVAGMDAGKWSMKADGMYDQVLAADSENWEARFSKAISYSFWPPMFGKQSEAIRHFEILVGQQANQQASPQFAQTHLLLGNLYEQQGKHDEAMAAWQIGADRFPDDADLRKQLGLE